MKHQLWFGTLLALLLASGLSQVLAQRTGKNPGSTKSPPNFPVGGFDVPLGNIFLSGKVVTDDNTVLTERAKIQTVCKGQKRDEAHTDAEGRFSFEFVTNSSARTGDSAGMSDADSSLTNPTSVRGTQRDWRDCQLQAVLPGYLSDVVQLSTVVSTFDHTDLGRIVLHRMEQVQGAMVSATSAAAPGPAKKAFEKGQQHQRKSEWDQAQQSFEKAVQIYPAYAEAWYELGRVQVEMKDAAGAGRAFDQAVAADPKFVEPYHGLAELAFRARQWQQVVNVTEKLLALNPVNFPDAWFFNSVGNYFQKNMESAEKSAAQGIRVDVQHTIPKLEYVLGMILLEKRDYGRASAHMQRYLQMVRQPADVAEAQKQLAEITRLSTTANVTVQDPKK